MHRNSRQKLRDRWHTPNHARTFSWGVFIRARHLSCVDQSSNNPATIHSQYAGNTQPTSTQYTVSTRSTHIASQHAVNAQPTSTQYTINTQPAHPQYTHNTHTQHSLEWINKTGGWPTQPTQPTHMHLRKCVSIGLQASALAATRLRKRRLQSIRDQALSHQPAKCQIPPPARQLVKSKATTGQIHRNYQSDTQELPVRYIGTTGQYIQELLVNIYRNYWSIYRNCLTVYPIIGQSTGSTLLNAQERLVKYAELLVNIQNLLVKCTGTTGQYIQELLVNAQELLVNIQERLVNTQKLLVNIQNLLVKCTEIAGHLWLVLLMLGFHERSSD